MKLFGYARVSSTDQDPAIQIDELAKAGVERALIFSETASGTRADNRQELNRLIALLREGDVLCVTRIDRLARSMHDFSRITHDLKARGIGVKVILQGIDTSVGGPIGELTMNLLASFAQFETQLRRERQMEGISRARKEGVYHGGKKRIDDAKVRELHASGMGPAAIAKQLGCHRQSVYRALEAV